MALAKSRVLDKGLWGMSAPMFADQAVAYSIPLVDMYFLSRISDAAAAAVGAVTPLVFLANAFLVVSAFAGASIANQRIGAEDYERGNATIAAYSVFVALLGIMACIALNYGGPWVASAMTLSVEVEQNAHVYLETIGWMMLFWGARVAYQTLLNIYGEPKWNSFSNVILFVVNLCGNYVAVYGFLGIPPSGVWGVALASVAAAGVSLLFVIVVVHGYLKISIPLSAGWKNFRVLMAPVLMIALPSILEPMSFQAYMITLNFIAAEVSELALKVKIYAFNTFLFCLMISSAITMATETIVAQRLGRGEFDVIKAQLLQSLKIALLGTSLMALIWLFFNRSILAFYSGDPAVIALGFWAFFLSFLAEPWRTTNILVGGVLRCSGDATFTSLSSISVIWLFSVPLAYFLAIYMSWGLYGLLIAALCDECLRALVKYWRWRQAKWMTSGVVSLAS